MSDYQTLTITREGQVATVLMLNQPPGGGANGHWELADAFSELRQDNSVRVVVLTGSGRNFKVPGGAEFYLNPGFRAHHNDPDRMWQTFAGITRCHQTMAEMEKPIVGRINGDAVGFGQSVAFGCDLIIAREDAVFMDHHMGGILQTHDDSGAPKEVGHDFSSVPGDGGLALVPMHMSLCKAKEYLMLAEPIEARELARLGIINYAVPADQLDAKVDDVVQRLLKRGAYALAWTKRVVNRRLVQHLNMTLDAGVGYEMTAFLQLEKLGGEQPSSL